MPNIWPIAYTNYYYSDNYDFYQFQTLLNIVFNFIQDTDDDVGVYSLEASLQDSKGLVDSVLLEDEASELSSASSTALNSDAKAGNRYMITIKIILFILILWSGRLRLRPGRREDRCEEAARA